MSSGHNCMTDLLLKLLHLTLVLGQRIFEASLVGGERRDLLLLLRRGLRQGVGCGCLLCVFVCVRVRVREQGVFCGCLPASVFPSQLSVALGRAHRSRGSGSPQQIHVTLKWAETFC